MKNSLIGIAAVLMTGNLYASPSFDCSKSSNKVENFICGNLFVSDLDNRLASIYRQVLDYDNSNANEIRQDQLEWIERRNKCQSDLQGKTSFSSCVKEQYNKQIIKLEKIIPGKQNETKSREYYRTGNKEHDAGNYYMSIKYFNEAYNLSDNYVDRVRALGAAATHSLSQGNTLLAAKYSEKILEIDPTSEFASKTLSSYKEQQSIREADNARYITSASTREYNNSNKEEECITKCLIKSFGTEICGAAIQEFAKEELDNKSYNIVTSPTCEVMVSKMLGQEASGDDIQTAILTGVLDDAGKAGLDSDDGFKNVLGFFAKGASLAIKVGEFNKCKNKCN